MSPSTARSLRSFLVVLASASAAAPPLAQEQLATFEVTAVVVPRCRIDSSGDVSFGALDPGRATDGAAFGLVRVACTRGTTYRVLVDNGRAFDPRRGMRTMRRFSGEALPYELSTQGDRGIASGWQRPAEVRLDARIRARDYADLPGGTYEDILRISLEY
ncbi:MAG: spore coat protein U domain-containing protein [Burkholderiales bacterium]|nr:spore coat protein U domain-containing protein [Burkholderiales bacterium]